MLRKQPQRNGPSNCLAKTQVYAKPKGVSDGQQVDIPVLEYIVMEGRSRLTKPDDWKCLAKQ